MSDNHDSHDGHGADHEYGKMDITEQEKTFAGFLRVIMIGTTLTILALIFMALVNG